MKTILVFVTTLDGKITKWGDPHVHRWSSKEDQVYFKQIWKDYDLFVMGSATYAFDPMKPNPEYLLVVMTSDPQKYTTYAADGQIEFTAESPKEIFDRFASAGHKQMVVVGGAHIATSWLQAGLIDELWLTLEPKIFASGGNFVAEAKLDIDLHLRSIEKVNAKGTLILKYEVLK